MDFSEAMAQVISYGLPVRREKWKPGSHVNRYEDGLSGSQPYMRITTRDITLIQYHHGPWTPSQCDMFARDWEFYTTDSKPTRGWTLLEITSEVWDNGLK